MRCSYYNTLIIHRFNGRYNRMDSRRKHRHERICSHNPDVIFRNLRWANTRGELLKKFISIDSQNL